MERRGRERRVDERTVGRSTQGEAEKVRNDESRGRGGQRTKRATDGRVRRAALSDRAQSAASRVTTAMSLSSLMPSSSIHDTRWMWWLVRCHASAPMSIRRRAMI